MYQTVNADAVVPMNGLRLSGPAVQPSRSMTFPLAGEGLALDASAEVMPHTKPAKSDTVAASRTARLKDTRVRFIKAPPLDQRPRVCARAVTLQPAPPLLASRGDSI